MFKHVIANDLMTTKVISLHPKDKLQAVKEIFEQYAIHHIPILVDETIVGLISKSDFLHIHGMAKNSYDVFIKEKVLKTMPVENYMRDNIICCGPEASLANILEIFIENEIHCLPVVDDSTLLGLITPIDLLKHMRNQMALEYKQ